MANYWKIKLLDTRASVPPRKDWKIFGEIITLGRLNENDCCIPYDLKISSVHARLKFDGENIQIDDLNSTNGVFIVDQPNTFRLQKRWLGTNPTQLKIGDSRLLIQYVVESRKSEKVRIQNWQTTQIRPDQVPQQWEAILVLDLVKSTETANKHGDNMAFYLKTRLEEITESVLKKYSPDHLKNTGDGFFATYSACDKALSAARLLLQRIEYRNFKTEQLPLQVRMALHYGKTYIIDPESEERHSSAINIAFKIEGAKGRDFIHPVSIPPAGRILATREFLAQLKENTHLFHAVGPYQIRGVAEPVDLFLVREPQIPTEY